MPQEQIKELKKHITHTADDFVTKEWLRHFTKKFCDTCLTNYLSDKSNNVTLFNANVDLYYASNTFMPNACLFYADRLYVAIDDYITVVKIVINEDAIELKANDFNTQDLIDYYFHCRQLTFEEMYMAKVIKFLRSKILSWEDYRYSYINNYKKEKVWDSFIPKSTYRVDDVER